MQPCQESLTCFLDLTRGLRFARFEIKNTKLNPLGTLFCNKVNVLWWDVWLTEFIITSVFKRKKTLKTLVESWHQFWIKRSECCAGPCIKFHFNYLESFWKQFSLVSCLSILSFFPNDFFVHGKIFNEFVYFRITMKITRLLWWYFVINF